MFTLTEARLSKVQSILDRYRSELYAEGTHRHEECDGELKAALKVGADDIRDLWHEVFVRYPRYKYVAAYAMQFSAAEAPVPAHRPLLKGLYKNVAGGSDDLSKTGSAFWERFKSKKAMAIRKEIDEARLDAEKQGRLETLRAELKNLTGELY